MAAAVLNNPIADDALEAAAAAAEEVESVTCECCGLTEECTPEYIALVRGRYHGRWICGLCAEAVKDEIYRSRVLITTEEALDRHTTFRSSPPPADSGGQLISAVRQLVRRSLGSPRALRSTPTSPRGTGRGGGDEDDDDDDDVVVAGQRQLLARSGSCFPALAS